MATRPEQIVDKNGKRTTVHKRTGAIVTDIRSKSLGAPKSAVVEPPKVIYVSPKDTAVLVRKELKDSFPGVKFSVKTSNYAGGSSISVSYEDGPSQRDVNDLIDRYGHKETLDQFDIAGTKAPVEVDGQKYVYMAQYAHAQRHTSPEAYQKAKDTVIGITGERSFDPNRQYDTPGVLYTASRMIDDYRPLKAVSWGDDLIEHVAVVQAYLASDGNWAGDKGYKAIADDEDLVAVYS